MVDSGKMDAMKGAYLGPSYDQAHIEKKLIAAGAMFKYWMSAIIDIVAKELSNGAAVGWMQGRMEFGPRALGGRSILGDPRSPSMQKILNLKVNEKVLSFCTFSSWRRC